jgi:hypothetical protein
MKTGTEREQSNGGEFPKTLMPSASINITHTLEHKMQLSLSLAFSLRPFFVLQIKPISHAFLSFFSRCTMLDCLNISFSIHEFNYLHRNLTSIICEYLYMNSMQNSPYLLDNKRGKN